MNCKYSLSSRKRYRAGRYLQSDAGTVTVGHGVAIAANQLSVFSYWLLNTFPILARIGRACVYEPGLRDFIWRVQGC